jgi:hypothetical protein
MHQDMAAAANTLNPAKSSPAPMMMNPIEEFEPTEEQLQAWRDVAEQKHRQWLAGLRNRNDR